MKKNCWEVKNCGREEGGSKVEELGVCPASTANKIDGVNSGKNGGRACWAVAGTLCGAEVQGEFAQKVKNCMQCEFYRDVFKEEKASDFKYPVEIINMLKK